MISYTIRVCIHTHILCLHASIYIGQYGGAYTVVYGLSEPHHRRAEGVRVNRRMYICTVYIHTLYTRLMYTTVCIYMLYVCRLFICYSMYRYVYTHCIYTIVCIRVYTPGVYALQCIGVCIHLLVSDAYIILAVLICIHSYIG